MHIPYIPTLIHSHARPLTLSSTHIYQPSQFNPKSGPQLGGTEVTITGSNLGAEQSDIQYVRIDGVNCTVIDYQPGIRYAVLIHLSDCLSVEYVQDIILLPPPLCCAHTFPFPYTLTSSPHQHQV